MSKKRDTVTYELKKGNTVLYIGTTNDPEAREAQHRSDKKRFGHLTVTSRKMTEAGAKQKESERLESYRNNHRRKNPRLNKNIDG